MLLRRHKRRRPALRHAGARAAHPARRPRPIHQLVPHAAPSPHRPGLPPLRREQRCRRADGARARARPRARGPLPPHHRERRVARSDGDRALPRRQVAGGARYDHGPPPGATRRAAARGQRRTSHMYDTTLLTWSFVQITSVVAFLASPAASWVNGHNIHVNGGVTV
jgi:NAD(P)-dependent dehydrogenase (short-subunit alcohol dehydrogenase family)